MDNTFGDNLKRIREERKLSQEQLASILGTSKQVVSRYETKQRSPKVTIVSDYADKLNVSLAQLTGYDEKTGNLNGIKRIPLLGKIAAGQPIAAVEHAEDWLMVDEHDDVDFALRVQGDSMTGVGIYDRDIIYVRKQAKVENGEIAVVLVDDGFPDSTEATCKRFYQYGKTVVLRPDSHSPLHKDREITLGKGINVHVQGKVIFLKSYIEGR